MPQLNAIGIVASDMARSIRFYRLLGLEVPETPGEGHIDTVLPNGVRFMLDSEEIIRSFRPDWSRAAGNQLALAFECDSPAEVDELGAGLGLRWLAAALGGADVLATDWAEGAVELLRENAARNSVALRAERVRWDEAEPLLAEAPWTLVLGSDLLYEQRNADQLLDLLPRLGADVLLADPRRPFAKGFLIGAADRWEVETESYAGVELHRLRPAVRPLR